MGDPLQRLFGEKPCYFLYVDRTLSQGDVSASVLSSPGGLADLVHPHSTGQPGCQGDSSPTN